MKFLETTLCFDVSISFDGNYFLRQLLLERRLRQLPGPARKYCKGKTYFSLSSESSGRNENRATERGNKFKWKVKGVQDFRYSLFTNTLWFSGQRRLTTRWCRPWDLPFVPDNRRGLEIRLPLRYARPLCIAERVLLNRRVHPSAA